MKEFLLIFSISDKNLSENVFKESIAKLSTASKIGLGCIRYDYKNYSPRVDISFLCCKVSQMQSICSLENFTSVSGIECRLSLARCVADSGGVGAGYGTDNLSPPSRVGYDEEGW